MNEKRWLIACDVDGTLLLPGEGNPGLDDFNQFIESHRDRVTFALDSGRSLAEMALVAERGPIARPDWLIAGVGTELYPSFDSSDLDREWETAAAAEWGRDAARAALASVPGLREQEAGRQHAAKLSYYFELPADEVLPRVRAALGSILDRAKIISCMGYFLDVIPAHGGKGAPIEFLARRLGIPRERVIAAGDSANDRDMLDRGFRSIVVGNRAPGELDDLAGRDGVYFSDARGAAGVMEGMRHFGCGGDTAGDRA